eukprot:CAMPEP_0175970528 /NCGR_PEP_ID=MMETSP0108-20121206/41110_1 /TAXON_ID=195067 ORGANISM="Goniomonas pacifica, Strain CCMP1869" /NCGR_SAMPLE_ID=MMETSP0108 /ASSEMBLY_ACC=CAM_ASM_000204 /LENGTH=109 /DNA_ID=CAMNT_0017299517 /DNA_START=153 /DNA_END=482 /DNA_ORIENTATION=+
MRPMILVSSILSIAPCLMVLVMFACTATPRLTPAWALHRTHCPDDVGSQHTERQHSGSQQTVHRDKMVRHGTAGGKGDVSGGELELIVASDTPVHKETTDKDAVEWGYV